ncbi:WXG100 family type VII secretion target [Nocardia sp. NPDC024068]|uniref:WXG100 family type VII secretion target n=1 Tax=Nocardia sp. NPDC024068 TaxID=3157197 RepID=UPI00340F7C9F
MANPNVTTDVAAMEAAAKHVENVNSQLQTEIGNVRNIVAGSAGNWEGAAAVTFRKVMDDYDTQSRKLHDVLAEIGTLIRENGKGYTATEQANQDALAALGGSSELGSSLNI